MERSKRQLTLAALEELTEIRENTDMNNYEIAEYFKKNGRIYQEIGKMVEQYADYNLIEGVLEDGDV